MSIYKDQIIVRYCKDCERMSYTTKKVPVDDYTSWEYYRVTVLEEAEERCPYCGGKLLRFPKQASEGKNRYSE